MDTLASAISESSRGAEGEFVEAIARGLRVIEAFDREHPEMTLSEVAALTQLSPATARRCLHTLEELGRTADDTICSAWSADRSEVIPVSGALKPLVKLYLAGDRDGRRPDARCRT